MVRWTWDSKHDWKRRKKCEGDPRTSNFSFLEAGGESLPRLQKQREDDDDCAAELLLPACSTGWPDRYQIICGRLFAIHYGGLLQLAIHSTMTKCVN